MSRMLSKMNLISVVQQLPKEDIETIQGYVEIIEQENNIQKAMIENFVKENQELKAINEQHRKINGKLREENQKLETEKEQLNSLVNSCQEEIRRLKKQLEEVEFIVGLRQKRNLIHKFDKEYDEEDKKKNPNRDYAGIMPDAEEVYKRYYTMKNQQKEFIEYMENEINKIKEEIRTFDIWHEVGVDINFLILKKQLFMEDLQKYKEIIGVSNENNMGNTK